MDFLIFYVVCYAYFQNLLVDSMEQGFLILLYENGNFLFVLKEKIKESQTVKGEVLNYAFVLPTSQVETGIRI